MKKQLELTKEIGNGIADCAVIEPVRRTRKARVRKPVDVNAVVKELSDNDEHATELTGIAGTADTFVAADREETLQHFVEAAWRFGNAVLWPGEEHDDEETRDALADLDDYFRKAADPEEAFVHFVGRVIVAETTKKKCGLLRPGQWMKRANQQGLMKLALDPKMHAAIIKKFPQFDATVRILAKHYLEFIKNPTVKTVLNCSDELQAQGGKGWMRVFYD